ncbi:putative protein N-lysine methyltransferase METTL21A [Paratrimastix pyriformis]|uniref:Uncharacterized protein n=1 Tax=Paratrimastix pyriformis TaxID=342808 RepID=A0ABQ8U8A0_9EUKA|nr:putative protein N-lysine methyltransferase METTL21A [Paratrimastix pyriformis]
MATPSEAPSMFDRVKQLPIGQGPAVHTREVDFFGKTLRILQDPDWLGGSVWDCELCVVKYLENLDAFPPLFFRGKRAIVLGDGTGLLGICLGMLGAECWITDLPGLIPLIQRNVQENASMCKIHIAPLQWGTDVTPFRPPFDFIFGADIIYLPETFQPLSETIRALAGPQTVFYLGYELRKKSDVQFFDLLRPNWSLVKISNDDLDPTYQDPNIGVFRVTPKSTLFAQPQPPAVAIASPDAPTATNQSSPRGASGGSTADPTKQQLIASRNPQMKTAPRSPAHAEWLIQLAAPTSPPAGDRGASHAQRIIDDIY